MPGTGAQLVGWLMGCFLMGPRLLLHDLGGFDEDFDGAWGYEDIEFAHRLITIAGSRPTFVPGIEAMKDFFDHLRAHPPEFLKPDYR
jgi:predicted glycosyltransferase involved in capsule biosynthesis